MLKIANTVIELQNEKNTNNNCYESNIKAIRNTYTYTSSNQTIGTLYLDAQNLSVDALK